MSYRGIHPMFRKSFEHYKISTEIEDALWNYLAYGLSPGSYTMSVLRNDFYSAICSSHHSLTSDHHRNFAKWLMNMAPKESFGSYDLVKAWMNKSDTDRMDIMIECGLRPHEFDILAGRAAA